MENSQFLLKWNNHQPTVVSVLDYLLNQEAFIDVTLACEGQSFSAHKVILSACSPYFQDLLMKNPCKHPIIFLKDVRSNDMESLLQFMYRGEINVQQDDLATFLKTAESLQIKGLADNSMKDDQTNSLAPGASSAPGGESENDDTRGCEAEHPPPPRGGSASSSRGAPAAPPRAAESPEPADSEATAEAERAAERSAERAMERAAERERVEQRERLNPNRSLLATALGKLGAGWPPAPSQEGSVDGVSAATLYPAVSMDFEQAGPSRLALATPPPTGLFPYALTPSPGAVTPTASIKEEPTHAQSADPDWASGASGAGSTAADSPERGSENGDVREPPDSPEKGVVSVNPTGWKHASLYPHGRGRPRAQPLPRLYECNLCGKTFNNRRRDRFLAHLRLHTGERPFKCLICGRGFNRQDHVTVHMRLHTGGKPFQCIVCKHRFAKQQELKGHACAGPMLPPENGITITPTSAVDFRTFRVRSQMNGSPPRVDAD